MDIRCKFCTEPWDNDTIHEEVEERQNSEMNTTTGPATYTQVYGEFRRYGCGAFALFMGTRFSVNEAGLMVLARCPNTNGPANETIGVIQELMGDDSDGAMSMLEDAEALGLL